MPGTLARYFFIRYAITIMWFLIGVVAIVLLVDFTETSSRMGDLPGYTLTGGLFLTLVRTPLILQQTIPFVALFAGMTVLISLNRRYELVVARAAGISALQFMRPFIAGALLLGLGTLFILNPLAAFGQRQAQFLESQWRASSNSGNVSKTVPWLRQSSNGDDVIIGATTIIENGGLLVDAVFVHFDTDGRIVMRQDAESATLEDGYWLLNKVQQTRPGEIPQAFATVQVPTKLRKEFVQEKLASPETVAFYDLSNKISVAKSFGISTKALETQFHSLLSLPLLLVAMTMIAATVSLKFSRFAQSRSVILGGILSGFVLYVVNVLVKAFGSSGVVPPFIAAWIPVVVALALGATILLHQEDG